MAKPKRTPIENQLRAYLKWCENVKQVTPMTMASKKSILGRFIREIKIDDIADLTNKKMDWWIEKKTLGKFGSNCNTTTIRTNVATVIAWLNWLRDMDYKVKIKTRMIAKPQATPGRRKWYSAQDIATVLDNCSDLLDEVMVRVLFDTGLRASEFASLRLSNLNGRKIYIVGKGRKQDWVYISEITEKRLKLWIETAKVIDYLWIKTTKKKYYTPLTVDGIRRRLKVVFLSAGFNNFQMHEMRHSFATDLRNRGADMDIVQKLMRHSSLQVTQRYLHNLDGDMRPVYDGLKNYDPAPGSTAEIAYIRGEIVHV